MAHKKFNRIGQNSTGTGPTTLTLGAAVSGKYRSLQTAGMLTGDTTDVSVQHETIPAQWVVARALMNGDGTITLSYDEHSDSPSGTFPNGGLVDFSAGNKIISSSPIAFEDNRNAPNLAAWLQARVDAGEPADWTWGNYTIPMPITINITADLTGFRFDGHGAKFTAGFSNTSQDLIKFIVPDGSICSVNGFSIANMTLDGTGAALPRKVKNCLSLSCRLSHSAIFGFEIDRVNALGANEDGILLYGNIFEGDIVSVLCRDNDRAGVEVRNPTVAAGTGIISSIKFIGGDFRTNKYGIMTSAETTYQEPGGIHVTDCDFIANSSAGIFCFAGAASITGCHFENNCTSNGGETSGAIWNVFGPIKIDCCDATSSNANPQIYLLDALGQVNQSCSISRSYSQNTDLGVFRQLAKLAGNGILYLDDSIPVSRLTLVGGAAWNIYGGDTTMIAGPGLPLQGFINAAQTAGVTLRVAAGTYPITPVLNGALRITAPLTMICDANAIFLGTGGAVAVADMVEILSSDVTIEGGQWDWNNIVSSGASAVFNSVSGAGYSRIKFKNLVLRNATWGGINLSDCSDIEISGCRITGLAHVNIVCAGLDVDRVNCHDNVHICPPGCWEAVNVVNLSGATKLLKNIRINDNTMLGSSVPTVGSCGIQIWANSNNYQPGPFTLTGNIVFGFAIAFSPAFCTNGVCSGNVALGSSLIGFEMAGSSIACSGNVCEGLAITQYGFTSDGAADGAFSGCVAKDCILYFFSVLNGGSSNIVFSGCQAHATAVIPAYYNISAFGISSINGVTISGCHVNFPNSDHGGAVYGFDVGDLIITGCNFKLLTLQYAYVLINNNTGTVRNNIKVKNNLFHPTTGGTGINVDLQGPSYGANVDVEGLASGALTQATNKSTALASGTNVFQIDITMNGAALAAGAIASFNWPNIFVTANDNLSVQHVSGGTLGAYALNGRCGAGVATIDVRNGTAGSLPEAIVLRATLTKSKAA